MKQSLKVLIIGAILFAIHIGVNLLFLEGKWNFTSFYWLDIVLVTMSFLVILATEKIGKKDFNKIGIAYSLLGMAKLISLAVMLLVVSKYILPEQKTPLIVHFILPAFALILVETLAVKNLLSKEP